MSLEERLEKVRSGPVPQNEESAKFQVIAPILENLGWDPADGSEFLLEYSVGGTKGGRVDIALRANTRGHDRLYALVEAKAPGSDLKRHVAQVLGYAFHEGVDICVLTTGLEWWLFLPREPGDPMQRRFAVMDMKCDPVERIVEDLRAFLHREALVKGRAEKKAKSVLKATLDAARLNTEIPKIWKKMLEGPDEELVELVGARVYERLNLRPEKSQVIAALRGKPVPMASEPDSSVTEEPQAADTNRVTNRAPSRRPVAILLWGTRHPVSTHKDVLGQVTDRLYERHARDFDTVLDLKGKRIPWAALNPEGFHGSHQVKASPYFINAHGNAHAIKKRAEAFLEHFGYDKSDLEIIFEE